MNTDKQTRFAAVFRQYGRALRGYLRRRVRSPEAAEDLMQETFARVYAADTGNLASTRNFLFRTAHNLAINHRRNLRNARTDAVGDPEVFGADEAASPEERLHWREELARLDSIIDALPSQCRQVFILQKIELRSHQEIAEQLGIAISTVEKHIARAVKTCHQHYRQSREAQEHGR